MGKPVDGWMGKPVDGWMGRFVDAIKAFARKRRMERLFAIGEGKPPLRNCSLSALASPIRRSSAYLVA